MADYIILKENPIGTRPNWDESFMSEAIKSSRRSSCWFVSSGSKIVYKNQIVSSGYNGASSRYKKNCLDLGCAKENKGLDYEKSLNSGECIGIHSEMNAAGHLNKNNSKGLTLYTTIFPCGNCGKNLEPYGIERIVFKKNYSDKEFERTLQKFLELGIEVNQLDLSMKRYWDIDVHRQWKKFDIWTNEEYQKGRDFIDNWNDF